MHTQLLSLTRLTVLAMIASSCHAADVAAVSRALANDNRRAAGKLESGVRKIALEARVAKWYPEADSGAFLEVQTFVEIGRPPSVPGPLIRVTEGTRIEATVTNRIPGATLVVHGLHSRPGQDEPMTVPPGETRPVSFSAGKQGTYFYWASTTGSVIVRGGAGRGARGAARGAGQAGVAEPSPAPTARSGRDSQLSGALIVDPPGGAPKADRIFVISELFERPGGGTTPLADGEPVGRNTFMVAINGKSWPHSERLSYHAGDAIRWRWINTSAGAHPMHLHGSHYLVESKGDATSDTIYTEAERRTVVTENMAAGSTMAMQWQPQRPGNWLFHCHLLFHIAPDIKLESAHADHAAHQGGNHAIDGMAGLVLGINVLSAKGAAVEPPPSNPAKQLTLVMRELPKHYGQSPAYGFALQQGVTEPGNAQVTIPGPTLLLTKGELTSIQVVNRLPMETSVHWHGIELQSYYDGVADWSGLAKQLAPTIPSGGTFTAWMKPPKAGTYMYHTHFHDDQLAAGLYGPLIVLEPGQHFDSATDHVFLASLGGPAPPAEPGQTRARAPSLLNGKTETETIRTHAGTLHRFRLINITPGNNGLRFSLMRNDAPVQWRAIAKDGADLPLAQRKEQQAIQAVPVGETYDFEFRMDAPGELVLTLLRPADGSEAKVRFVVE